MIPMTDDIWTGDYNVHILLQHLEEMEEQGTE